MTNHERAESQFQMAKDISEEMQRALDGSRWRLALRRAQEVVELCLKALMMLAGGDYPREHDVAKGFKVLAKDRGLDVSDELMSEIAILSESLAKKRAPALYGEIHVSEAEARQAAEGAHEVLALAHHLWHELAPKEDDEAHQN